MAEKKKMSVAEILAAARKNASGEAAGTQPAASESASAAPPEASSPPEPTPASAEVAPETPAAKPAPAKPAAAKGAGGRPSVAEMMAQARAAKGGGGGAAPAAPAPAAPKEKPVAAEKPKPAPKPAAAEKATAEGPIETASILAAARTTHKPGPVSKAEAAAKGQPVAAPAGKTKLAVPPMPEKPAYAVKPDPKLKPQVDTGRRFALFGVLVGSFLALGFSTLAATFGLWTLGLARFMFPNILREPPSRFKVGFPSDFAPGQVETKFIAQFGVWVVNYEYNGQPQIYALQSVCTHLGCTPNWLEAEQKFKCPCHGSGFYKDGINFEGPAPRPLERYAIKVSDDGQLEIDKSRTFHEELGQWSDTASFVSV